MGVGWAGISIYSNFIFMFLLSTPVLSAFGKRRILLVILAPEKIGDSPIKSDMKLGPQTHLGAESRS